MYLAQELRQGTVLRHRVDVARRCRNSRIDGGEIAAECNADAEQNDREAHQSGSPESLRIRCVCHCKDVVKLVRHQSDKKPLE